MAKKSLGEKPQLTSVRFFKKERDFTKKAAEHLTSQEKKPVSRSEVVRRALAQFEQIIFR